MMSTAACFLLAASVVNARVYYMVGVFENNVKYIFNDIYK